MTTSNGNVNPESYFTDEARREYEEFCFRIVEQLKVSGLSKTVQKQYYDFLTEYKRYVIAATCINDAHNSLTPEIRKWFHLYNREQDPAKARVYLDNFNKVKARRDKLSAKLSEYKKVCIDMEDRVIEYMDHIEKAIQERDENRGRDDAPQLPSKNTGRK